MKRSRLAVIGLAVSGIVLSGCGSVPPAVISMPEQLRPIESKQDSSKPIFVSNVTAMPAGKIIGQLTGSDLCFNPNDLMWGNNPRVLDAMRDRIIRTLKEHGYNAYSGPDKEEGERVADISVAVVVENLKANICYSGEGTERGAASLTLRWEVSDNKRGTSFAITAAGAGNIMDFSPTGDSDVFVQATGMAAENMLAQEAFFNATKK